MRPGEGLLAADSRFTVGEPMPAKIRASILHATRSAKAELAAKRLPATAHAIEKLGAATAAIGGHVGGWAGDFEKALAGGSAFTPGEGHHTKAARKRKRKRKAAAATSSSSSSPRKRKRKRKAATSSPRKRKRKAAKRAAPRKRKAKRRKARR